MQRPRHVAVAFVAGRRPCHQVGQIAGRLPRQQAPPRGLRGTLYGISGTALFVLEIAAVTLTAALLRGTPGGAVTTWFTRAAESVLIWLLLQYVLLSGRIPWRRLVPGALLAGAGQLLVSAGSAIYMPNLIAGNSARYGAIGVALALITWLLIIAGAIVAGAVAGAELARQPPLTLSE